MRKRILAVLAGLLLAVGVGATPASASWHQACPPFHAGDFCVYNGYNGGGGMYYYPQASTPTFTCLTLPSNIYSDLQSLWYDYVSTDVLLFQYPDCAQQAWITLTPQTFHGAYDYDACCGGKSFLLTKSFMLVPQ